MDMKDLNFSKKVYKFYGFGIFSDDLLGKRNSTSLILTNLTPKVLRAIFQAFMKFGQAIVDAMFVQKISNFW
jgi:hypothetical protein